VKPVFTLNVYHVVALAPASGWRGLAVGGVVWFVSGAVCIVVARVVGWL